MYDNILKALGGSENTLSYEKQAKNYEIFSDLMKKGVDLQELVDKANAPKEPSLDESLFQVMEEAVSGEKNICETKAALDSAKEAIIFKICMSDPRYSELYKAYKDTVVRAYTEKKGSLAKEICEKSSPERK